MKKFKIITIPFNPKTEVFNEDELNKFIFNKTVKNYQVQFFQMQNKYYWTVFLEYEPLIEAARKESAGLNESDKLFFEKLRVWRKETAEKAGVPVYVISTGPLLTNPGLHARGVQVGASVSVPHRRDGVSHGSLAGETDSSEPSGSGRGGILVVESFSHTG